MAKRKKRKPDPTQQLISDLVIRAAKIEGAKRRNHVCPIYRPKTVTEPELYGSGVFLAIGHRRFLLTAAHVFGPPEEGHQQLLIPSNTTGNLIELRGTFVRSTQADVGIVLLDDPTVEQIGEESFVGIEMADVDDIGDGARPYLAMGFPWRVSPLVRRRERVAKVKMFTYVTELLKEEDLIKLELRSRSHFLLRYAKRHSRDEAGRDLMAPDPHGMSGGPIWRIEPQAADGKTTKLVGIIIEWHRREAGVLGFRLPLVLAGIADLCPDIADLIPRTETISIQITSPPLAPYFAPKQLS